MLLSSDQRFPKAHRLLRRADFLAVQQNGRKVTSRLFIGLVSPGIGGMPARLGITASRKFGNAVARNRVKRLIREAFRTRRLAFPPGISVVVLPKREIPLASADAVYADLRDLGARICRMLETP